MNPAPPALAVLTVRSLSGRFCRHAFSQCPNPRWMLATPADAGLDKATDTFTVVLRCSPGWLSTTVKHSFKSQLQPGYPWIPRCLVVSYRRKQHIGRNTLNNVSANKMTKCTAAGCRQLCSRQSGANSTQSPAALPCIRPWMRACCGNLFLSSGLGLLRVGSQRALHSCACCLNCTQTENTPVTKQGTHRYKCIYGLLVMGRLSSQMQSYVCSTMDR